MSWLMIALASLYTVYKNWSHCIIQPERGGNSGAVTKVIKFTFPHTHKPKLLLFKHWKGKKSVCVCVMVFDRLCCRLQVYIGRIRGPSNTTANCYCPHLVRDIVEHIMVFLHIRKDFLTLSIHQKSSRFLPLSTYLHVHTVFLMPLCRTSPKIAVLLISCKEREKKKCLLELLYQERSEEKWQSCKFHKRSSKPREMQMTGERSPRQEKPALLWPAELSDGLDLCWSVSKDPLGNEGGTDQSFPKTCIQKHILNHFFSVQRTVELWNVAEFILDLLILIVVVSDLCRFVQWRRWHKGSFTRSGYLCSLRHFPAPKVTQITIG